MKDSDTNRSYDEVYGQSQQIAGSAFVSAPQRSDNPYAQSHADAHAANQKQCAYPQGVAYVQAPPKQGKGWIAAIVVTVCICATILISVASCSAVFTSTVDMGSSNSYEAPSSPVIGVIDISGTIQYDGSSSSPEGLKKLLERAESDQNIKGVILKVNSGGGVATAGEEMSELVYGFSKPIVVVSESTNASAAYEISSQSDYIFAAKTSSVGSIGVLMQLTDLSGLYDMLGIEIESITSADSKDALSGNRPMTDEERAWYQHMVDQINQGFIDTVARGRSMSEDQVRALANGLAYTGIDAVENGLVDEIGYMDDAIDYLSEELGYSEPLKTFSLKISSSDITDLLSLISQTEVDFDEKAVEKLIDTIKADDAIK